MRGYVWQLVTYALVEVSPMGVIFGAIILWNLGGFVEQSWGRRRFLLFSLAIVVLPAIATVLLALLVPALVRQAYPGAMVLTGSLWVAYGLQIGRGQTNFWGLVVTGNVLALIGAGFVFLNAAFAGISHRHPRGVRPALHLLLHARRPAQPAVAALSILAAGSGLEEALGAPQGHRRRPAQRRR